MKTVNVDVANRSKERTREQFEVNGLNSDQHEIRVMDVFAYLDYAKKHQLQFDLIVLDPPTFARHRRSAHSVWIKIILNWRKMLSRFWLPAVWLITSTNAWNVSRDDFFDSVNQAFV
ncbi:MAG: hypothetical protein U5K84_03260 [Alkalibacterium sp.]|nr:hypothetical protein [Alkalibacterium sp.]